MQDFSDQAIQASKDALVAYCKFIRPNEVGITGSHQVGFYIKLDAYSLLFDEPGVRGSNRERSVTIKWQDEFETESRFKYYGQGTRNEYRITRFGRDFPFLNDDNIGNLLVLCKTAEDYYKAYVLQTDDEIEDFLNYFGITPPEANGVITDITTTSPSVEGLIADYVEGISDFPSTRELADKAREIYQQATGQTRDDVLHDPDRILVEWVNTEYSLFKAIEKKTYAEDLAEAFNTVDPLIELANTILNRRKSRAGKSLEHHLEKIFDIHGLPYSAQEITEGRKRPDFIIPSIEAYRDDSYDAEKLVFLGAKTTCKDRWRQVLNEAARIPHKHLFTLQPGISSHQLDEMEEESLTLVVPAANLTTFPPDHRGDIMTLKQFIDYARRLLG